MDAAAKRHLEQLLILARAAFSNVAVIRHDVSEERAIEMAFTEFVATVTREDIA